ncbi:MAG: PAS domain-containing protein, partial [Bacteroidota bacterium]
TIIAFTTLGHVGAQTIPLTPEEKAWIANHPVIKLGGDPAWEPYVILTPEGSYEGLEVDILERVSQVTGLKFEIVGGPWPEMVSAAQERQIDGLLTSTPRPSRKQYFNFTHEYAFGNILMYGRVLDTASFRRLRDFDGLKLGVQSGNQINHDLLAELDHPDVTDYPSIEALVEALLRNEVDYVMSGGELTYYLSKYGLSGIKTAYVLRESRVPLVYSVRKDWPQLVTIINKALATIPTDERNQLMAKWLLDFRATVPAFSQEAYEWLSARDTLSIGLLRNWSPLSVDEDGVADGLIPTYYRELNQLLGLALDFRFYDNRSELLKVLKSQDTDLVVLGTSDSLARGTVTFHSFPLALVSKRIPYTIDLASLRNLKVGISDRNPFREQITAAYQNLEFVLVESLEVGVALVEQGELDGFVGGLPLISYHLKQFGLSELRISGVLPMKLNLRAYSNDPMVISVLNEAYLLLPSGRMREIVGSWYGEEPRSELVDFQWFWKVIAGFLLLLVLVFVWNRSLAGQIARRKRIEVNLRSSRANLKTVIENSNALICSLDKEMRIITLNENYAQLIKEFSGKKPAMGDQIVDFLPGDRKERWVRRLRRALDGEKYSKTYSIQPERGGLRYFETSFSPIYNNGEVEGVSCYAVEVTELTELSRYFVNLLENMTDFVYLKDKDLKYVAASQSLAKLKGLDSWRDLVGKTDREIHSTQHAERFESVEREIMTSGEGRSNVEEPLSGQDGSLRWLNSSTQPVKNEKGEIIGLLGVSYDFTDRREVEEELMTSKANLTALVESTTSRIYSLDRELRLIAFNSNFFDLMKEMTGIEVKPGTPIIELIPEVWRDLWRKRYEKALSGKTYNVTDRDKVMDVNRYFQTFFNPIRLNNEIVGVSCFAQDITEVTRLNQIMVSLLQNSTDFIYVKDLEHRFLAASDSLAMAHGFEKSEELLGKTDFDIHPKELAQDYYQTEEAIINEGTDLINHEDRYVDKDGKKWVESNKRPLKDSQGEIVGLIGITREVTYRKKMETELRKARDAAEEANVLKTQYIKELKRKQNELLILNWFADSAPVGLSMADLETEEIVFVNPALLNLLQEEREGDVIGRSIRAYRDDQDQKLFDQEIKPRIEENETWIGERRIRTASGQVLWTFEHYFILRDEEGAAIALANVVTDITHRRKMEADLREKRMEADRANRAKSAFLANMSHEIRTPLNSIIGFSDLLNQMVTDGLHQSYLQAISASGKTLLALINDILDISKIESGRLEIRQVPLNLKVLSEEVRSMFTIRAREKNLDFRVEVDNPISEYLLLDELRIKQILINLLGNSFKFTNEGGVYLRIKVMEGPDKRYHLEFEVQDTGIGISPSAQDKIYYNFYQDLDRQADGAVGGTGLGLAIVYKLVKLMGGEIRVNSKLDQGTTFNLTFPETEIIDDVTAVSDVKREQYASDLAFEAASVLLVDDVENNRFYLRELFRNTPILTWEARDGVEALEIVSAENIELILTDIRMPRMDGFELVKALRQQEVTAKIPIVAVTASVFGADSKLKDLFDAILYKPVLRGDLFQLLKRFIPHRIVSNEAIEEKSTINDLVIGEPLRKKLRQALWSDFEALRDHQPIAEVLALAKKLQEFEGDNGEDVVLKDLGQRLASTVNNLDIAGMLDQLRAFEQMLESEDKHE